MPTAWLVPDGEALALAFPAAFARVVVVREGGATLAATLAEVEPFEAPPGGWTLATVAALIRWGGELAQLDPDTRSNARGMSPAGGCLVHNHNAMRGKSQAGGSAGAATT